MSQSAKPGEPKPAELWQSIRKDRHMTDVKPGLREAITIAGKKLRVGDTVTWRNAPKPGTSIVPVGVTGCKIISFGVDENGRDAALIEVLDQQVGAWLDDLHPED